MEFMSRYDKGYYDNQSSGSLASARVVVPILVELVAPKSAIDVGCGVGTWLAVCKEMGIDTVWGVDGDWVSPFQLQIPPENFEAQDLEHLAITKKADITICLEVGEHLPESSAAGLVAALTSIAPVVLFGAAIPLQGGTHHVNEQWPAYWANLFREHNYVPIDCIRGRIWNDQNIEYWYAQNTFVYVNKNKLADYPKLAALADPAFPDPLPLVHPKKFLYVAERYKLLEPFMKLLPGGLVRASKRMLSAMRAPRLPHV